MLVLYCDSGYYLDMDRQQDVLDTQAEEKIVAIAKEAGITYVALFGSVARGEGRPDSDIDLAIRFGRSYTLFDLAGVQIALAEALGKTVDVIPIDDAYPFVRESMAADLIVLLQDTPDDIEIESNAPIVRP